MANFHKDFVRVEWLAFAKVLDLMREYKLDDSYFVSSSYLQGDKGVALDIAERGRDMFDEDRRFLKTEELQAADFGLKQEIGEFHGASEDSPFSGNDYFLTRAYRFEIIKKGDKVYHLHAAIIFAKITEHSDWVLDHEALIDDRNIGDKRWVIYRPRVEKK